MVRSSGGGLYWDAGVDLTKLKQGFRQGAGEAKKFSRNVTREGDKVKKGFTQASAGTDKMSKSLTSVKNNLGPLIGIAGGAGLFLILTQQLTQVTKQTARFARDFEMAMKEVATISLEVRENFGLFSNELINLAAQGPDDAVALAKAYYQIVSAGYDGAKGLELLRVSSEAATAGITDTQTAADGITTVLNAWGKSFEEAELVADIMFKTVEKGKTTFPELASSIAQVAPIAATLKIPFEEVMSLIASITKQGTTTSMAFTQIRSALVGLSKEFGGDIFQQGKSLQEVFEDIAKSANYSIEELTKTTGRVEGASAILATTGGKFQAARKDLEDIGTAAGSMTSAYETMMEAVDNKWLLVHNKWNRELKTLGERLKLASGGMADFMNRLLTNRELDVINPAVDNQLKQFRAELAGIEDEEERRETIQNKILEIREKQRDVGKEIFQLEKQQAGSFRKSVEWLSMGTGMNKLFENYTGINVTPGYNAYKELEIVREQFDVNKKLEELLMSMFKEDIGRQTEDITTETEDAQKAIGILSEYYTQLEELKQQLGTGSMEHEVQLRLKIEDIESTIGDIESEIGERLQAVWRERTNEFILESGEMISRSAKSITQKPDDLPKEQLKEMKKLTEEEKKRLEHLNKIWEIYALTGVNIEKTREALEDTSEILGAISYAFGEFDSELGQAVGKMADLAYNAANLFANISSGNIVGAISSGIGMIGNVLGLFNKQDDPVTKNLENINRTLEKQSAILASMPDLEGYYNVAQKQMAKFSEELDVLNEKLKGQVPKYSDSVYARYGELYDQYLYEQEKRIFERALTMGYRPGTKELDEYVQEYMSRVDTMNEYISKNFPLEFPVEFWDSEDIVSAWAKGNLTLSDDALDTVKEINEVKAEMQQLLDDQYQKALGFSTDSVAQTISSGIQEGLQLSENGLGDWTENFGELMKKALTQNLMSVLNEQILTNFMGEFNEAMKDGTLDGDVDSLRKLFVASVEQAEGLWEELSPVLQEFGDTAGYDPLTGAVSSITEDTAGIIAGQFTAMRFDLKEMNVSLNEMLNYSMEGLDYLREISENTTENYRLKAIEEKLTEMNLHLRDAI